MIYLDNAATTFPKPEEVYLALDKANREYGFNAGRGSYDKAKNASNIIGETREELASLVNTKKENVLFSTSSTEALNTIIFGLDYQEGDNIYVSPFEHNSVMRPLEEIRKRYNINMNVLPFDKETWEVKEELEDMFALKKPKYIFCSSKSNVTGYKLPFKQIFELGKKYQSINVLDASQSFGVDKSIDTNYTDYIVFAGHKSLYASFGVAGFIKLNDQKLKPFLYGGTGSDSLNLDMPEEGESRYEAGSKNIVAIYGLHESIKWLKENDIEGTEKKLTDYFLEKIKENKKVKIYVPKDKDKCVGIISLNIEGYSAEEVGSILNEEFEICVRTGYHCCPLVHDFIRSKMHYGTVRVSFNYFNTFNDVDKLVEALKTF